MELSVPLRAARVPGVRAALSILMLAGALGSATGPAAGAQTGADPAEQFRVVDCLLPGEVRGLGRGMTFLTPRRPIKTSVGDCQDRGGEYVVHQAGSTASTLAYWLPLAEQGDPEAQTNVGEAFERGVGSRPDYVAAASWYQRAADKGYARAQINLGHLYEKGLGVAKDPVLALNLYRKAAGIKGEVVLDDGTGAAARDAELRRLRTELEETRKELERARKELDAQRTRAEADIQRLKQAQGAAVSKGQSGEAARLADQVRLLEEQLTQQRRQVAMLQQSERRYQEQIQAIDQEASGLRVQVDSLQKQMSEGGSRDAEIARLQKELGETRDQLERSRREMQAQRQQAQADINRLQQQSSDARNQGRTEEAQRYEQQVNQLRVQLAQREQQLDTLERSAESYRNQIRDLEGETAQLRRQVADLEKQLDTLNRQLASASKELADRRQQAQQGEKRIAELRDELARRKQQGSAPSDDRIAEIERALKRLENDKAKQASAIERLDKQVGQYQEQISAVESQRAKAIAGGGPAPRIELIDPKLAAEGTRGPIEVKVRGGLRAREIVGKVDAPLGLFSFKINQLPERIEDGGLFKVSVPLARGQTPVSIVAVDRQGRQSSIELVLVPETGSVDPRFTSAATTSTPLIRDMISPAEFGKYYALIIGNTGYTKLPKLDTPANDAKALGGLLRDKYAFNVTTLLDATRYQILQALNEMRKRLTKQDNLLIYYAGHGELDKVTDTGYWLPIDAEPDSPALWVNNADITSALQGIQAKHIIVVADSCYSGTLTRSALTSLETGQTDEQRVEFLKAMARAYSRVILTSGGLHPVLDGGGGEHSVFAKYFLGALSNLRDATEASKIYQLVRQQVVVDAARLRITQQPVYQTLAFAGHQGGDFIFLPVR